MAQVLYLALRQTQDQRAPEQEVTLDGVRVRLRAIYNARADRWYLDVRDLEDTVVLGGLALVPGVDLLAPYKYLDIPQGQLFVQGVDRLPATFDSLDTTVLLKYRRVADVV